LPESAVQAGIPEQGSPFPGGTPATEGAEYSDVP